MNQIARSSSVPTGGPAHRARPGSFVHLLAPVLAGGPASLPAARRRGPAGRLQRWIGAVAARLAPVADGLAVADPRSALLVAAALGPSSGPGLRPFADGPLAGVARRSAARSTSASSQRPYLVVLCSSAAHRDRRAGA